MLNLQDMKNMKMAAYLNPFIPFFIVSNALNNFRILSSGYKTKDLRRLIVPGTLAFFIPPLVANLIYPQFIISNLILSAFLTAILLFPFLSKFPGLLFWSSKFGQFGKFGFLCALRDNDQPISCVAMWLLISDFVGVLITKLLLNDLRFSDSENNILGVSTSILIVYMGRHFKLDDCIMIGLIFISDFVMLIKERFDHREDIQGPPMSLLHLFKMHKKMKKHNLKEKKSKSIDERTGSKQKKPKKKVTIDLKKDEKSTDQDDDRIESLTTNESDEKKPKRRGRPKKAYNAAGSSKKLSNRK